MTNNIQLNETRMSELQAKIYNLTIYNH